MSFYTEITVTKQKRVLKSDQKSVKLKEVLSSQQNENIEKTANYLLALIIERYTTVMWKGEFPHLVVETVLSNNRNVAGFLTR